MKLSQYRIDVIVGKVRNVPGLAAFLGQKGIPLLEFVTFMDHTLTPKYKEGTIIPVLVIVVGTLGTKDFKYNFVLKLPKTTILCSYVMNERKKLSFKWLYLLAKERQKDQSMPLWFICKTLAGTLQSMAAMVDYKKISKYIYIIHVGKKFIAKNLLFNLRSRMFCCH